MGETADTISYKKANKEAAEAARRAFQREQARPLA